MHSSIGQRIKRIIDNEGLNINSFSKYIGLNNNVTIGRIISENRKPGYEVLNRIILTYGSKYNTDWIITGRGNMLIKPGSHFTGTSKIDDKLSESYVEYQKQKSSKKVTDLNKENEFLKQRIKDLEQLVLSQKETINILKSNKIK